MRFLVLLFISSLLVSCSSKKLYLNDVPFSEEQASAVDKLLKEQSDKVLSELKQNQVHKYVLKGGSIKTLEDLILVLENSGLVIEFNHAKKEEVDKLFKVQKFFERKN